MGSGEPPRRKPRLMLFADSFIHGGTERQFLQVLRHLDREKYDVMIGCLKRRGPFLSEVESFGIPIFEFPITSLHRVETVRWLFRLVKFLRGEKIDLLHAFEFYTNVFAVPAARFAGVPAVVASRREIARNRPLIERWALRIACALVHGVVANSRAAAGYLVGLRDSERAPVEVIHNCVDAKHFASRLDVADLRSELGLPAEGMLVGVVGALRPEKGHHVFLQAAARVSRENPAAGFVLVGDGPELPKLEAQARELGLNGHVIFAGDRSDVSDWLAALDVVVSASEWESLPNAVLEAMAAGRPVVATQVGGTAELVADGETGYVVPPGDPEALADRVLQLLRHPEIGRAFGQAGRARVEREFAPARMIEALEKLYDRLLRERRPSARILQISNFPPPICGWSLHTQFLHQELEARGADSRVMDIGPARRLTGRDCIAVKNAFDYAAKLIAYRLRGFTFHVHVNGDSWKGYLLALAAVLLGRLTGRPSTLTFHAGPSQLYFPRRSGIWFQAFRLLFLSSGEIICNHDPVKREIVGYGVESRKVHAVPAFSVQYSEKIPVPLSRELEFFMESHEPVLFTYLQFRPEFTVEALLEAFGEIQQRYPRAGLVISGPREVPPDRLELIQRAGLNSSLLIAGNLPHAEFLTLVGRSDIFIRTHLRDGVCASVLEALRLGVPVVASEDGHRPASVVTYAPGDAGDLKRVVARVLDDLPAYRAAVTRPEVGNNLEAEVAVLLARGDGANS